MTDSDRARLQHMLKYARKAVEIVGADGASALDADETRLLALVASLIILGEAATQLSKTLQEGLPDLPWRQARNLRNLLVHRYFEIRSEELVSTVHNDLPPLILELDRILAEEPTP